MRLELPSPSIGRGLSGFQPLAKGEGLPAMVGTLSVRRHNQRIRHVTPEVQGAARQMRGVPTAAERVLWAALRGNALSGLRFRRQHPVGRFVLDFYCPSARLVVEVDGSSHDGQKERDDERTAVLETCGLRMLRFTNTDVLQHLPRVLETIVEAAIHRE